MRSAIVIAPAPLRILRLSSSHQLRHLGMCTPPHRPCCRLTFALHVGVPSSWSMRTPQSSYSRTSQTYLAAANSALLRYVAAS